MGKLKRKKLANALGRLLTKVDKRKEKERRANAHTENSERAKQGQIKKISPKTSHVRPQYNSKDRILLVGEGNFSFARSLCENYLEEGAEHLVATCYDSEEVLYEKYSEEAKENVELVREFGATVLFGIDATDFPKEIKKKKYTKIVFNFPHVGAGIKDQDRNVIANQKLLNGFLDAATPLLTKAGYQFPNTEENLRISDDEPAPEGEIHITLKTSKPYNLWAVKSLVKAKGELAVKSTSPFYVDDFPGYEHRRTLGFKKGLSKDENAEIISSEPKRYVFVRKEVMEGEIQNSIKGSQKRKLEDLKAKMGKKVKRKKTDDLQPNDEDDG
ncbi:25S rRNA (uridine-N(3))-methyltransferase [Choanephora cucurbitarum]|uniref:25S rRNA (Uridine-N(3))-methyltransferase n=1 Tax=Choanephora cucurbitarum TaxID=101091 RepID=A0A1C7NNA8_9FUNG|nr:25S rRNA (uridine-N(3))-methyltransferase [Choanephora cucurbitarum]